MTPKHLRRRVRFWFAGVIAVCVAGAVKGQDSAPMQLTTTFVGMAPAPEPAGTFRYKWPGRAAWLEPIPGAVKAPENEMPAGLRHWKKPNSVFSTANMGAEFDTYAAEVPVGAILGSEYTFHVQTYPFPPAAFGLPPTDDGKKEAEKRSRYVREHFGLHYHPAKTADVAVARRAFQVALWEIVHETAPATGKDKYDLTTGAFQADYPPDATPEFVTLAQKYLKELSGDDAFFDDNSDLKDWELVRLKGVPNTQTDAAVVQSQFALRRIQAGARENGGGGGGNGLSADPRSNGGGGFGPGFGGGLTSGNGGAGRGGIGGGAGGNPAGIRGSLFPGAPNPRGTTTSPPGEPSSFATASVPVGFTPGLPSPLIPTGNPVIVYPRRGPDSDPPPPPGPDPGPFNDPVTVPAPAGAVLGGIAFLTLLARRGLRHLRTS